MNRSQQHTSAIHEQASDLGLCLEIRRGQTEHPVRPIHDSGEKFLIGGDDDCDLQLGGDDIPALHSVLQFDGSDLWIEAVAPEPPLRVNCCEMTACLLRNGDRIEIGAFELFARLDRQHQRLDMTHCPNAESPSSLHLNLDAELDFDPEKISDFSAEDLVDALDREMQMIEHFDRRQKLGADALMDAVWQHRERPAHLAAEALAFVSDDAGHEDRLRMTPRPIVQEAATVTDQSRDLDRAIEHINDMVQQLEERSQNIERRELASIEAAAQLLEVQERMAAQLETLEQQLSELRSSGDRRRRASA